MNSISSELAHVGIDSHGAEDHEGYINGKIMNMDDFESYALDQDTKAVVVGLDTNYTYAKMCIANLYLTQPDNSVRFIATNDDAYDMVNGRKMPGAGSMVQSIKLTLGPNPEGPEIIGKPNPYVVDLIMKEHCITDKSK